MKGLFRAAIAAVLVVACSGGDLTGPNDRDTLMRDGVVLAIGVDSTTGASIETNKDDYQPGEIVHLVGKGWAPGETVNLHMTEEPDTHADVDTNVVADSVGEFSVHYYDVQEHDVGVTFTLTATGHTSGSSATAIFTDGTIAADPTFMFHPGGATSGSPPAGCTGSTGTSVGNGSQICVVVGFSISGMGATHVQIRWRNPSGNIVEVDQRSPSYVAGDLGAKTFAATFTPNAEGTWTALLCGSDASNISGGPGATGCQNGAVTGGTATFSVVPGAVSTTTSVAAQAPSHFGQAVTFTATVTPASGPAAQGTVTFYRKSAPGETCAALGSASQIGSPDNTHADNFTVATSALAVGTHEILACYSPSAGWTGSEGFVAHTVNKAVSTLSLASDKDPALVGETITFTATVTVTPGVVDPDGGTVNFAYGSSATCNTTTGVISGADGTLGSAAIAGGTATAGAASVTINSLGQGTYDIIACYGGNGNIAGSQDVYDDQDINVVGTTTLLSAAPNPSSFFGNNVTFTATVTASDASTPTGSVSFYEFEAGESCSSLNGEVALHTDPTAPYTFQTSALSVGAHTITACFDATLPYTDSEDDYVHTVNKATSSLTVDTDVDPQYFGLNVAITATISITNGVADPDGGSVNFAYGAGASCNTTTGVITGGMPLGSATIVTSAATINVTSLPAGTHDILACYGGDGNVAGSEDAYENQVINRATTSMSVTSSLDPSYFGDGVTFEATITVTNGVATPTGTVGFSNGGTCNTTDGTFSSGFLGSATIVSGKASLTITTLPVGEHDIVACYATSANIEGSTATYDNQNVEKAVSALAVASSADPQYFGNPVTFTATVTFTNGSANPVGGTVNFRNGGTCDPSDGSISGGTVLSDPSGTIALVGSAYQATITVSDLAVGNHDIVGCYAGNTSIVGSGTFYDDQTIDKAASSLTIASSNDPAEFGENITFTATVEITNGVATPTGTVNFAYGAGASCNTTTGVISGAGVTQLGNSALALVSSAYKASITLNNLPVGVHDIVGCYAGNATVAGSTGTFDDQDVDPATTTTVASSPTVTPQYSDKIALKATVTPHQIITSSGTTELTGVVRFYFQTLEKTCEATDPGAAGTGVDASDVIAAADDGIAAADYIISDAPGAYKVTACFYSTNGNFGNDGGVVDVTVGKEDAKITPDAANVNSVSTTTGTANVTLKFIVKEANPEPDPNAGALPGDIITPLSTFAAALQGVGGGNVNGSCSLFATNDVAGLSYSDSKTFKCDFTNVPLDAYEVVTSVSNTHYQGSDSDALSVYDPNAGFVTGGGKFIFPGSTDMVNFGLVFHNPSKKSIRGNIVVIRHMANGDICRFKSNALEAPAISKDGNGTSWNASFSGKGNYICTRPNGTTYDGSGNLTILGWVQDNGQGSASPPDKFWVKVSNALNNNLIMPVTGGGAPIGALLTGGNIQVPQPGGR